MNRRDFLKTVPLAVSLPAIAITCKYEDDEKGPEKESMRKNWDYRVYCYEREQGEWTFSQNVRGSFAYQREYMSFEEEHDLQGWGSYAGWMDQGKLHFTSLEEAQDFVDMHVRTKDDTNLIDHIYDIYRVKRGMPILDDAEQIVGKQEDTEIQVAHYWFNGDTGSQIHWVAGKPYTDYSKMEYS